MPQNRPVPRFYFRKTAKGNQGGSQHEKQRAGGDRPAKRYHEALPGDHRKSSALTNKAFAAFLQEHGITHCYLAGADAAACIKSTCFNMRKSGYAVHVLSDCITSYDKKKLPELLAYYESKGCAVMTLQKVMRQAGLE